MTFLATRIAVVLFVWQVSTAKYNRAMPKALNAGGTPQGEREPLTCEDHLGRRACLRKIMRPGFAERCRNSRLLYRYHCCRSCARHIGINVTPDGFFRDVGNFTYYDPTCPNIIDRAAREGREDVFCMIIYATFRENACAGPMAQYSCAKTCRLSCGRQELKKKVPSKPMDNRWVVQVSEEDLLCKAGCGFYGNPQWKNYCSKCWRLHLKRSRGKSENSPQDFSAQCLQGQIDRQSISPVSSKTWPGFAWDRLFDPMWNTLSSPKTSSLRSILKGSPSIELGQTTGQSAPPVGSIIPRRLVERQLSEESLNAKNEFVHFLETLPKPIAHLVGKQVNLITANILRDSSNVPLDDVSEAIQDIYNSMSSRLSSPLKDSPSLVEEILEQVETYICFRCYNSLFWSDSDEEVADISFQERIRSLHWVTCGPLDPGFDLANVVVVECFEKAISEIIATNSHRSPKQKLASLTSCCNLIFQCHKESRGTLASADEFLPALIYVVLKANPPLILSNVKFISRFALPSRLMSGEAGYYFTNLCCALNFIQNLNAESLKMNPDEFEAYSCGQLIPPIRDNSLHGRQAIESIQNSLKALKALHDEACMLLQKANKLEETVQTAAAECRNQIDTFMARYSEADDVNGSFGSTEELLDAKEQPNLPSPLKPEVVSGPFEKQEEEEEEKKGNNDIFN